MLLPNHVAFVCLRVHLTDNYDSGPVSIPKDNSFRQPPCLGFECYLTNDTRVWVSYIKSESVLKVVNSGTIAYFSSAAPQIVKLLYQSLLPIVHSPTHILFYSIRVHLFMARYLRSTYSNAPES